MKSFKEFVENQDEEAQLARKIGMRLKERLPSFKGDLSGEFDVKKAYAPWTPPWDRDNDVETAKTLGIIVLNLESPERQAKLKEIENRYANWLEQVKSANTPEKWAELFATQRVVVAQGRALASRFALPQYRSFENREKINKIIKNEFDEEKDRFSEPRFKLSDKAKKHIEAGIPDPLPPEATEFL